MTWHRNLDRNPDYDPEDAPVYTGHSLFNITSHFCYLLYNIWIKFIQIAIQIDTYRSRSLNLSINIAIWISLLPWTGYVTSWCLPEVLNRRPGCSGTACRPGWPGHSTRSRIGWRPRDPAWSLRWWFVRASVPTVEIRSSN